MLNLKIHLARVLILLAAQLLAINATEPATTTKEEGDAEWDIEVSADCKGFEIMPTYKTAKVIVSKWDEVSEPGANEATCSDGCLCIMAGGAWVGVRSASSGHVKKAPKDSKDRLIRKGQLGGWVVSPPPVATPQASSAECSVMTISGVLSAGDIPVPPEAGLFSHAPPVRRLLWNSDQSPFGTTSHALIYRQTFPHTSGPITKVFFANKHVVLLGSNQRRPAFTPDGKFIYVLLHDKYKEEPEKSDVVIKVISDDRGGKAAHVCNV